MKQRKVCVGSHAEYPGAYAWPDYEIECPDCGQMSSHYGEVSTTDKDGDEHYLCDECAKEVLPLLDD